MTLGAAHDGVDARDQLVLVERLGHVVVGAEAEAANLILDAGKAREVRIGLNLAHAQGFQDLVAAHIRQIQVEKDDVVVVNLAEIDTFFAERDRLVDVKAFDCSISSML